MRATRLGVYGAQDMESVWLGMTPFVAGEHLSLGDLPIITELETMRLLEGATEVRTDIRAVTLQAQQPSCSRLLRR